MPLFSRFLLIATLLFLRATLLHALPMVTFEDGLAIEDLISEENCDALEESSAQTNLRESTIFMDAIPVSLTPNDPSITGSAGINKSREAGTLEDHTVTQSSGSAQYQALNIAPPNSNRAITPGDLLLVLQHVIPSISFDEQVVASCRKERNHLLQEIITEEQRSIVQNLEATDGEEKVEAVFQTIENEISSSADDSSLKSEKLQTLQLARYLQEVISNLEKNERRIKTEAYLQSPLASNPGYTEPNGKETSSSSYISREVEYKAIRMKQRDEVTESLQQQGRQLFSLIHDFQEYKHGHKGEVVENSFFLHRLNRAINFAIEGIHFYQKTIEGSGSLNSEASPFGMEDQRELSRFCTQVAEIHRRLAQEKISLHPQLYKLLNAKAEWGNYAIEEYNKACTLDNEQDSDACRQKAAIYINAIRLEDKFFKAFETEIKSIRSTFQTNQLEEKPFSNMMQAMQLNKKQKPLALKKAAEAHATGNNRIVDLYTQATSYFQEADNLWEVGTRESIISAYYTQQAGLAVMNAARALAVEKQEIADYYEKAASLFSKKFNLYDRKRVPLEAVLIAEAYYHAGIALTAGKEKLANYYKKAAEAFEQMQKSHSIQEMIGDLWNEAAEAVENGQIEAEQLAVQAIGFYEKSMKTSNDSMKDLFIRVGRSCQYTIKALANNHQKALEYTKEAVVACNMASEEEKQGRTRIADYYKKIAEKYAEISIHVGQPEGLSIMERFISGLPKFIVSGKAFVEEALTEIAKLKQQIKDQQNFKEYYRPWRRGI